MAAQIVKYSQDGKGLIFHPHRTRQGKEPFGFIKYKNFFESIEMMKRDTQIKRKQAAEII
ncbi:hypothetical protein ACTQ3R_09365 [Lawsonibacter sp. LCP25S3_E2]|uniref:hypothetical protein n=1 Tax=Lawsonibacter sp. LCP25S3_E2 TaxID=3438787 RepID=UPI003F96B5EA